MLRVLLAILRPLHTLAVELGRVADALDRAHPKRTSTLGGTYVAYDPEEHETEVERREVFERRRGRPLSDEEELPSAFDHTDRLAGVRKFFEVDDHKPD